MNKDKSPDEITLEKLEYNAMHCKEVVDSAEENLQDAKDFLASSIKNLAEADDELKRFKEYLVCTL